MLVDSGRRRRGELLEVVEPAQLVLEYQLV